MNNLIKTLFTRATFEEDRVVDGVYHPYIPLQFVGEPLRLSITSEQYHKFAELIIEECINACMSRVGNSDYNTSRIHCCNDIKQHFGIK